MTNTSTGPRAAWRSLGFGMGAAGGPAAVGLLHPVVGQILGSVEVAMVLVVLIAALFGTRTVSDRAFRLLRWIANRPEPAGPRSRPSHRPRQNSQAFRRGCP